VCVALLGWLLPRPPLLGVPLDVCDRRRRRRRAEAVGGGAVGIAPVGVPGSLPSPMALRGSGECRASSPCLCSHACRLEKGRVSGAPAQELYVRVMRRVLRGGAPAA
jgi:hypothetical protein